MNGFNSKIIFYECPTSKEHSSIETEYTVPCNKEKYIGTTVYITRYSNVIFSSMRSYGVQRVHYCGRGCSAFYIFGSSTVGGQCHSRSISLNFKKNSIYTWRIASEFAFLHFRMQEGIADNPGIVEIDYYGVKHFIRNNKEASMFLDATHITK